MMQKSVGFIRAKTTRCGVFRLPNLVVVALSLCRSVARSVGRRSVGRLVVFPYFNQAKIEALT